MSDLLHALAWLQAAASARSMLRAGAFVLAASVAWLLWTSEAPAARGLGFVAVDAALLVAIGTFAKAPMEWANDAFASVAYLALSAGRVALKGVLMGLALVLSLIYFISPLDFIPDVLLGLGWIDDALVAFGLIACARRSRLTLPTPVLTAAEAAEHPAWRVACLAALATGITALLRSAG